jgi:hypothetical protein
MEHTTNEVPQHDAPNTSEWMMICLPGRVPGLCDLHQLEFKQRPTTTAEFLTHLKLEYHTQRFRPFPRWGILSPGERSATEIRFVKFQTIFTRPGVLVEVIADQCFPEREEGWVFDSRGDPARDSVGPGLFMAWTLNGRDARAGKGFYELVPRKLHEPLPRESRLDGWGLYVVEEEYWKGWYVGVVMAGTVVVACIGGIVYALLVIKTVGVTGLPDAGEDPTCLRVMFAVLCFTVSFIYLKEDERV